MIGNTTVLMFRDRQSGAMEKERILSVSIFTVYIVFPVLRFVYKTRLGPQTVVWHTVMQRLEAENSVFGGKCPSLRHPNILLCQFKSRRDRRGTVTLSTSTESTTVVVAPISSM
jgi:hypothetical protein